MDYPWVIHGYSMDIHGKVIMFNDFPIYFSFYRALLRSPWSYSISKIHNPDYFKHVFLEVCEAPQAELEPHKKLVLIIHGYSMDIHGVSMDIHGKIAITKYFQIIFPICFHAIPFCIGLV